MPIQVGQIVNYIIKLVAILINQTRALKAIVSMLFNGLNSNKAISKATSRSKLLPTDDSDYQNALLLLNHKETFIWECKVLKFPIFYYSTIYLKKNE